MSSLTKVGMDYNLIAVPITSAGLSRIVICACNRLASSEVTITLVICLIISIGTLPSTIKGREVSALLIGK
jgi:hypothetical protein